MNDELHVRLPDAVRVNAARRAAGVAAAEDAPSVEEVEALYRRGSRDEVIARAIIDGKITAARAAVYRNACGRSPEVVRAELARLEPVYTPAGAASPSQLDTVRAQVGLGAGERR
jgi:hypothetical protein